ncbi:MAG: YqhG family protein [Lysinibacillus sp.]
MFPQEVHSYLRQFFIENECSILGESDHYLTVQLTIDIDKRIMNRPFYWRYVEATNGEPNPAEVTFITDQNKVGGNIRGEVVHFGSPRLTQVFQVTGALGGFVKMYEKVDTLGVPAFLMPWLAVNYKISYCSDQTKEVIYSLGINLITGDVRENFQKFISGLDFDTALSEDGFCVQYIIKPMRALKRLDEMINNTVQQSDDTWAEEAKSRWQRDQRILEYFYEDIEEKPESYEIEKKALEEQYETKVKIEIISGGLFYLT